MDVSPDFFDSFFLKVSVDQFSLSLYIPINNQQGGGEAFHRTNYDI
jgi:hypothetical protein